MLRYSMNRRSKWSKAFKSNGKESTARFFQVKGQCPKAEPVLSPLGFVLCGFGMRWPYLSLVCSPRISMPVNLKEANGLSAIFLPMLVRPGKKPGAHNFFKTPKYSLESPEISRGLDSDLKHHPKKHQKPAIRAATSSVSTMMRVPDKAPCVSKGDCWDVPCPRWSQFHCHIQWSHDSYPWRTS